MVRFTKYNNPKKRRRIYDCGYGSGFMGLSIDSLAHIAVENEKRKEVKKDGSERSDT